MQWFGSDTMSVRSGQVLGGKYRLLSPIGEGGMGAVWSAVHVDLERTVAIKFLRRSALPSAAERFMREARQAAHVTHRYVVDVFDSGVTEEGTHYMVQELLQGTELSLCIFEGPAWDVRDALRFVGQCLTGLAAVHDAGLVHRDIKPENIFVANDSEGPFPKLLDFGTCEPRGQAEKPRTQTGKVKKRKAGKKHSEPPKARLVTEGTPGYMAPEQLRGLVSVDGRADLYSTGVVIYEWLTGRRPHEQSHPEELLVEIQARSHVPLVMLRPDLGMALSDFVQRALSPHAGERFESAKRMREELLAIVPRLEPALTIVQKDEAGQPIGSKTARLLTAASSPFGPEQGSAARSMLPTARPPKRRMWPLAAAVLLMGTGISLYAARTTPHESMPALGAAEPKPPVRLDTPRSAPLAPAPEDAPEADERIAALPEIELTVPERAQRKRMPVPARLRLERQVLEAPAAPMRPRRLEDVRLEVQAAPSIEANLEERELTSHDILRLGL